MEKENSLPHGINLIEKRVRAECICDYMEQLGKRKCVCFSCGNASQALKEVGLDVLDISPRGDMLAQRWFKQYEIANAFPDHFDATSGHLPIELMNTIADRMRVELKGCIENGGNYAVHTGSGETLAVLSLAFPSARFTAVYGDGAACEYSPEAPLNDLVKLITR